MKKAIGALVAAVMFSTAPALTACNQDNPKTAGRLPRIPRAAKISKPSQLPASIGNIDFPTDMAFAGDGALYFTEKTGAVRLVKNSRLEKRPIAAFNVPKLAGYNETGLLGLALSPDFNRDRLIYVYHTYEKGGRLFNRIVRFDSRRPASRRIVYDRILGGAIHDGGKLRFGPDGKLYVSVGETNQPRLARDTSSPNGKILRLNPDGSIPADNPFKNSPVFAYGLRNVFGMTFDNRGRLFAAENGPEVNDEIDQIKRGADYGWPIETGSGSGRFEQPLITYKVTNAPTGIIFYEARLIKRFRGRLLFGDWNSGALHALTLRDGKASDKIVASFSGGITALALAPDGAVYVATQSAIMRLDK